MEYFVFITFLHHTAYCSILAWGMCQKLLLLPQSKTSKQTFTHLWMILRIHHWNGSQSAIRRWPVPFFSEINGRVMDFRARNCWAIAIQNNPEWKTPDPRLSFCTGQFVKCSALEILMPDRDMPLCVCYTDGFAMPIRLNLKIFLSQ